MRPLTITAALAAATMALLASPGTTRYPLDPARDVIAAAPKAKPAAGAHACDGQTEQQDGAAREHSVSDISWFQGTLEEAFTRHTHTDHRPLLHF